MGILGMTEDEYKKISQQHKELEKKEKEKKEELKKGLQTQTKKENEKGSN